MILNSKRLGQHFLINKSAISRIVAALDLKENETVIEIGPGKGSLTIPLLGVAKKLNCKIIGIEKDSVLSVGLQQTTNNKNLEIVVGDALKILPTIIHHSSFIIQKYKVVGNIPYYITGKLLRILSELENKPSLIILMIQKEVAQRIMAKPPQTNLLSAITQFWADPEILFTLNPKDFSPAPEVNSAVIKLVPKKQITTNGSMANNQYYDFVKVLFKQPRQTILNNLKRGLNLKSEEIVEKMNKAKINVQNRPQDLSLEQIGELWRMLF